MPSLPFWADYIRSILLPEIDALAHALSRRVLPGFANLEEEANEVEEEEFQRLQRRHYSEDPDVASLAELAQDRALTHYLGARDILQGIINLFAVGLWHLVEQQLAFLQRRRFYQGALVDSDNPNFAQVVKRLLEFDIDVKQFASFGQIEELQLLANCIKHGDGRSCAELRTRRPSLFELPGFDSSDFGAFDVPVIKPLGGSEVYVTAETFQEYVTATKGFLSELADTLDRRE